MSRIRTLALPLIALAVLGGCANAPSRNTPVQRDTPVSRAPVTSIEFGTVRSVEMVRGQSGNTGTGAVIGGVVGAVAGRSVGDSSRGKNVGTVIGAVGGALIGNEIEKQQRETDDRLRVVVSLDRGGQRSIETESSVDLRAGDRVRIENGRIIRLQ